jgi:hypothetical protein
MYASSLARSNSAASGIKYTNIIVGIGAEVEDRARGADILWRSKRGSTKLLCRNRQRDSRPLRAAESHQLRRTHTHTHTQREPSERAFSRRSSFISIPTPLSAYFLAPYNIILPSPQPKSTTKSLEDGAVSSNALASRSSGQGIHGHT